jgi:peptidoglycan L-alanyl-D-glutamate endopeptidase CwlK
MRTFSKRSLKALEGVHPKLVSVITAALHSSPVDFMVLEGVRTPERQKQLYAQGRTAPGQVVTWTLNSRHFKNPATGYGMAVDLLPEPYDWKDPDQFDKMAIAVLHEAMAQGVRVRWGGDWDEDGNFREAKETDSPHFELHI